MVLEFKRLVPICLINVETPALLIDDECPDSIHIADQEFGNITLLPTRTSIDNISQS